MRVLYFSRDYTTHDRRFLAALAGTEHRVAYLRLERRGLALEDRPLPAEIRAVRWAGGQQAANAFDLPRLLADLKRVIRELQPELIHAGPLPTAAFLVALAGFRPLVSMSWGYDLLRDARRNPFLRRAARFTLRRSAVMVGDCEIVRRAALALGMPADRIVTFPWGVDLKQFSPDSSRPTSCGPFTLLSTRAWEPAYGVEVLARAFVRAARQNAELRLVMLGGGSQADLLRRTFARGGVLERVAFPGQASQGELPAYYRAADVYVSASRSDGTSISLLEAMACGRPAIVSDIPGNREWIEPGVTGWWFPDGDAEGLAETMLEAHRLRRELAEMGGAARRVAERRADWQVNFRELLRAYEMAGRAF